VGMGFGLGLYVLSAGGIVILLVILRVVGHLAGDRPWGHDGSGATANAPDGEQEDKETRSGPP